MPESVLCEVARVRGASCVAVDGWTVPDDFGDPAAEYRVLREEVGLVDLAFRERLRVTGEDRMGFLQGMLSNDIKELSPGRGCVALLLTDQGKVVADFVVLALADAVLLDGMANASVAATAALERYIVADDVEIAALGGADHALGFYGPRAAETLGRLGVPTPPAIDWAFETHEFCGAAVRVIRVPTPDAGGFVCHLSSEAAPVWWARCLEAGVPPVGQRAFDTLRIESGVVWHGRDVSSDTLALEAPLEAAISFKKGCYLGQEVMERVTARGHVNRRLVGLEIGGDEVPVAGDRLYADEHEVGRVTSAAWSWRLARPIALGFVRREHWAPGVVLAIQGRSGRRPATVRALPFL